MSELQFIISLVTICTFIGSLAIALYRVRVHHKVLFDEKGELNFVTPKQLENVRHETCPVHQASMDMLKEVGLIQKGNIQRMNNFEETTKEAHKSRENIQEILHSLNIQIATILANTNNMASDIQELKKG